MQTTAIFPGTFDPITFGHIDLIKRTSTIFPKVIVAIAENKAKHPVLDLQKRLDLATEALEALPNVTVLSFRNLLIDFAKQQGASVIVRGVRAARDFEYELQLSSLNRVLSANLNTIFLAPDPMYSYISSTFVKELAALNGDLSKLVPENVITALQGLSWP